MRLAPILLLSVLVFPLGAQQTIDRRIAIASDASIRIWNMVGTTRIIGWERDSIAVTGVIPPGGGTFYIAGSGRGAKLGVERPNDQAGGPPVVLEIRVPRMARLSVKATSATVEAFGLGGELEASAISGSIRVEGSLRLLVAESMDGNLNVSGAMDIVRLKGGTGSITLRGARGDVLATTVGGGIVATDAALNRAHLETVSGTVSYEGSVDPNGTLEVVTHSGDVTLRLPTGLGADFELESFDGGIVSGFPGKGEGTSKGKPRFFRTGGGGARVTVRSFKGEIRLLHP